MQDVADKCVFVGHGTVKGALYDLGTYPGAVEGELMKEVKGDVWEVKQADPVFQLLDEYEGAEYQRRNTMVILESGEISEAFIYWYTGATEQALLIEEGDYLNYLKNKKDRLL